MYKYTVKMLKILYAFICCNMQNFIGICKKAKNLAIFNVSSNLFDFPTPTHVLY